MLDPGLYFDESHCLMLMPGVLQGQSVYPSGPNHASGLPCRLAGLPISLPAGSDISTDSDTILLSFLRKVRVAATLGPGAKSSFSSPFLPSPVILHCGLTHRWMRILDGVNTAPYESRIAANGRGRYHRRYHRQR